MRKLAIILLLLVACQYVQIPTKRIQAPPEIYKGTSGLEVSFNPASTADILMCKQAEVIVGLKNTGAYKITDGKYVWIIEDQFLNAIDPRQKTFSLDGKSEFNNVGGFDQKSFKMKNTGLPTQLESYPSPVIFQACYNYQTLASAPVCIDPDIQNLVKQKPCRAQPVTLSGGQGAPLAVTKVETLMVPEGNKVRPMFRIYVQNLGTGQVIAEEDVNAACSFSKERAKSEFISWAKPYVELQERALKCAPEPVRIETGKETRFVCDREDLLYGLAEGTFSTVLSIELKYGYINTALFPLTITRLGTQPAC